MSSALVISGGGSKGAFAVGVLKDLISKFPHLTFDVYVGTSAGALIVTLASVGRFDELEQIYTTTSSTDIFDKFNIGDRLDQASLFDVTKTINLIKKHYPDERFNELKQSSKKVFLTTTSLKTGMLTVFTNDATSINPKGYFVTETVNADHYRKAVLASSCVPVYMPPIRVNLGVPNIPDPQEQFVDGGVLEYVGIQMAIDAGATEILAILLSAEERQPEPALFTTLFPVLERTIDIFATDVGKNDLSLAQSFNEALIYIDAVKAKMLNAGLSEAQINDFFSIAEIDNPLEGKQPLKLFVIRPESFLGGGPGGLIFNPDEMKQMLAKGETQADKFIASLDPNEFPFA